MLAVQSTITHNNATYIYVYYLSEYSECISIEAHMRVSTTHILLDI